MPSRLNKAKLVLSNAALGFWHDDCYTKSSVLTLYTLQSIVPFLAFLLGLAHGFGFENYLKELIINTFAEQKEVLEYAMQISDSLLKHLKGGIIAGLGFLYLFWTIVTLLGYIEYVLNEIWRVETPRTWTRKFSDYLAITIICPLILVISSSITVYVKAEIANLKNYPLLEEVSVTLLYLFNFFPFLLSWLLFFLLYLLIPNTQIKIIPRIIAAVIAGTLFQAWQLLYINAQIYIFSYNVVYGTVAVLPLFLIWLQVSWLIALAGAELSAHMENDYYFDRRAVRRGEAEKLNNNQLGLLILYKCLEYFYDGTPAPSDLQIAKELKLPLNVTRKMLEILVEANVLGKISSQQGTGYRPVSDPARFSVMSIVGYIQQGSNYEVYAETTEALKRIDKLLKNLENAADKSDANITLQELIG